jgi:hypothetical protein
MAVRRPVEDAVFAPVPASDDELDFLAVLRMERMRDVEGTAQLPGAGCSRFVV